MPGFLASLSACFLPSYIWEITGSSVTGAGRAQNEDSIGFAQNATGGIAILADGVGGHNAGEEASQRVCAALLAWFAQRALPPAAAKAADDLQAAITAAHDELHRQSQQQPQLAGMATTLAVVLQHKRDLIYAWAGDSRIYLLRNKVLTQLSEDHSVVEDMIRRGELTRTEAEHHPMANLITSSIANKARIPQLGVKRLALAKHDILLLVSDGVSGVLAPAQLKDLVTTGADAVTSAAQQAQSTDDCSAVIVRVKGA